jgi:hypothetical protein
MATLTALYENSATISTTEYSLTLNSTTGVPASQTGDGYIQVWLDLNAVLTGDVFELKIYEKVQSAGTQRLMYYRQFVGQQTPPHWISIPISVMYGWDVTLKKLSGSDRAIGWSIRAP